MYDMNMRKKKWLDFMDTTTSVNTMRIVNFNDPTQPARPLPYPELYQQRVDWATNAYERKVKNIEWLHDDSLPYAATYTGTEIFAQAMGCKVHYSGDNMPFALSMLQNLSEIATLKIPKVHETELYKLFETASTLRQRLGSDILLQLPDMQSPVDIAALVMEKSAFFMGMIDQPEAIKELIIKTETLLIEFLDMWFKEFGTSYIAHYPDYYMEGGITFSEDEIGGLSSEMFVEFCKEPIDRLTKRYGGCAIHCCANSRHQWDNFKNINGLRLLNLLQPQAVLNEAGDFFGENICHWHMASNDVTWPADSYMPNWARACSPKSHVVLNVNAYSREEALQCIDKLTKAEEQRLTKIN